MTLTRRLLASVMAATFVLMLAGTALAMDPPVLTGTVYDETGKLDGGAARIDAAAKSLKSERDITLYVLYINKLDGEDPAAFTDRVAAANNLSAGKNVVMLVSLTDRKDAVWSSAKTDIDSNELTAIRTGAIEPKLKAGDFIGAVEAAAVGFKNADANVVANNLPPPAPVPVPREPINWAPIVNALVIIVLLIGGLIIIGFVAMWVASRLRERQRVAEMKSRMEKLAKDAHTALIKGDEDVRSSLDDLAYAEAQYGAEEIKPLRANIVTAQDAMKQAFKIGQQIDDDDPETYDERYDMFQRIVSLTGTVEQVTGRQEQELGRLHDLETTAGDTVRDMVAGQKARTKAVKRAQDSLDNITLHGASALESVQHNIEVAVSLHALADKNLATIQPMLDSGKSGAAVPLIRETQKALAQATSSLDAVNTVNESLAAAQRSIESDVASATAEIAKATTEVRKSGSAGLSEQLDIAKARLAEAAREVASSTPDFLVAHKAAVDANSAADGVLDAIRDAAERQRRAVEQAKDQIRLAASSIAQANSYIESHRSQVGRRARSRLTEAQTQYRNISGSNQDLFAAALVAQAVTEAAENSYSYARQDVSAAAEAAAAAQAEADAAYRSSHSSSGSYDSSSHSSGGSYSHNDSFSIGSFGGGSSGGSFGGGGGGGSSGGGW